MSADSGQPVQTSDTASWERKLTPRMAWYRDNIFTEAYTVMLGELVVSGEVAQDTAAKFDEHMRAVAFLNRMDSNRCIHFNNARTRQQQNPGLTPLLDRLATAIVEKELDDTLKPEALSLRTYAQKYLDSKPHP